MPKFSYDDEKENGWEDYLNDWEDNFEYPNIVDYRMAH